MDELCSELETAVEKIGQLLTQDKPLMDSISERHNDLFESRYNHLEEENQNLRDELQQKQDNTDHELLEKYKVAVDKLRDQTKSLRDKLRSTKENDKSQVLESKVNEQDSRIDLLSHEKDMLTKHVETLQSTINEQCSMIEHLSNVIYNTQMQVGQEPQQPVYDMPQQDLSQVEVEDLDARIEKIYLPRQSIPVDESSKDLKAEIATLDMEIQYLQTSLKKALKNP